MRLACVRWTVSAVSAFPYQSGERKGTYWGIRSDIADYPASNTLSCPSAQTAVLADYPTRLAKVDDLTQQRLVNWGYAMCDAAMRAHVVTNAAPGQFPYPTAGIGD